MADTSTSGTATSLELLPTKVRVLSLGDVDSVRQALLGAADKWYEIGTALKLSKIFLEELKKKEGEGEENLHLIVTEWLGGNNPCPTWKTLGDALRSETVGGQELADQLDKKYFVTEKDQASGSTSVDPRPLGCGIESCICEQLIVSMNEATALAFPYLALSEEIAGGEDERALTRKLRLEYQEVVADYDKFASYTWRALARKGVTVESLSAYLVKTELFQSFQKLPSHPDVSLFNHFKPAFEACKSLDDVLLVLRDHVSPFSHNLVVDCLLNLVGGSRDRQELDNFRDKYYFFMRRKATLFPSLYAPPSKSGYALVHFTLKRDIAKISLMEVDSFSNRLTYNMCISRFSMKLIALIREEEGVVTYVYQIPSFARNLIFPLNDEQIHSMRIEAITAITCCSYKITISEKTPEGVLDPPYSTSRIHADEIPLKDEVPMEVGENSATVGSKVPLYASLPLSSPFRIDTEKVTVPSNLERMQERCPGVENYVALIPQASDKTLYASMVLCQHAAERRGKEQHVKCIVIANSKSRAHEMFKEMRATLPSLTIHLFTGTEEDSMTVKLCLSQDIVIICSSGKFHHELESDVIKFAAISLLLVDDCHFGMRQTPVEASFHQYIVDKVYHSMKPPIPQIVGLTSSPGDGATGLDEEAMQNHLLRVAGGMDSVLGMLFTDDVYSDTYLDPHTSKVQPKPSLQIRKVLMRDARKDIEVTLLVEMRKWEESIDMVTSLPRWLPEYGAFIELQLQSTSALLDATKDGETTDSGLAERLQVLELLQCYAQAIKANYEFGIDNALSVLQAPIQGSSMLTQQSPLPASYLNSLQGVVREVESLMERKSAVVQAVLDVVCKQFNNQVQKSRGILFVDSFTEAQFLCSEITKSHFLSRPFAVPRCVVTSYSVDACLEVEKAEQTSEEAEQRGKEGIRAFSAGESRLLLIPYALESETVDLENVTVEFDFLARLHNLTTQDNKVESEYVLTFMLSPQNKPFLQLRKDFDLCRLEAGLKTLPTGEQLKKRLTRAQESVMYSYQSRFIMPISNRKKKKNEPDMDQIQLRCKKCKVLACHGLEIYSFFVDGGRHCVVPHRDFSTRYSTKPYHSKHKAIKRINRLKRMFCSNCGSPWGTICHFLTKGCQLPVLKSKHFIFEMRHKYYSIKMWADALFKMPPITAYPGFHIHGPVEMEL